MPCWEVLVLAVAATAAGVKGEEKLEGSLLGWGWISTACGRVGDGRGFVSGGEAAATENELADLGEFVEIELRGGKRGGSAGGERLATFDVFGAAAFRTGGGRKWAVGNPVESTR